MGDAFAYDSYEDYFKKTNGYLKEKFEVSGFFTSRFTHHDNNAISRLRNLMASAIAKKTYLPKYILIVPDDDLVKYVKFDRDSFDEAMRKLLTNIMVQHNKYIITQKESLSKKSQKEDQPQIIWIEAPCNDNFANNSWRRRFNTCLNQVSQFYPNTNSLDLKKVWDDQDTSLYVKDSRRFTAHGYSIYWQAVDTTFKYVDTILMKKIQRKATKNAKAANTNDSDKYRWRNPNLQTREPTTIPQPSYSRDRQYDSREPKEKFRQYNLHEKSHDHRRHDKHYNMQGRRRLPSPPPARRY